MISKVAATNNCRARSRAAFLFQTFLPQAFEGLSKAARTPRECPRPFKSAFAFYLWSVLLTSTKFLTPFFHLNKCSDFRQNLLFDNSPLQLLQSFSNTTSVPLVIEWFFTSVSIAIETRYQNMPIMAVWRKQWGRHILGGNKHNNDLHLVRLISSDGSKRTFRRQISRSLQDAIHLSPLAELEQYLMVPS